MSASSEAASGAPAERAEAVDLRGPVFAVAAWAGAFLGTGGMAPATAELAWAGPAWLVPGVAGAIAAVLAGWARRWLPAAVACAGVTLLLVAAGRSWVAGSGPIADWAAEGAVVTITARVAGGQTTSAGIGGPVWLSRATLEGVQGRGKAWLSGVTVELAASGDLQPPWAQLPPGSLVRTVVRLAPAEPGEAISAWARVRAGPEILAAPSSLDAAVTRVRSGLRQAVAGLPPEPRALVPALVVGDTEGMPEDLVEKFRTTGLTHLTAVSGANLTLLLAALTWIAARVGVLGWRRRGVAVLGVLAFVLLCRSEPSVLRAAAMGLVGLAALGWGGRRQGLRYLSWAVVGLLLVDPWLSRSIGFALSVCASAGIVAWATPWSKILRSWLPGWLAEAIAVPVAAQLATQPIVTAISGQLSLVGIVANLLAGPLVGPGTVLGFTAAGLGVPAPLLAAGFGWAAGGFAQCLCWIAALGSAVPGAALSWPATPAATVLLAAICGLLVVVAPTLWRRPWLFGLLVVVQVVVLVRPTAVPGWPPAGWQLVSCDVGQGDATVLNAGGGAAVVVDAGPDAAAVDRCLDQLGVTSVPWLVLTHLHADHASGVAGVANGRGIGRLLFSGITQPEANWYQVKRAAGGVPVLAAEPGLVVAAGEVRLEVLARRPLVGTGETGEDSADQNDSSLVLRATLPGLRVLLSGDLEEAGQGNAVATVADLGADVLLVPHHGSAHQDPAYLAASRARVALVSVGADNDYGHPAARTLATVAATGARVFRTDLDGAIAVAAASGQLVVTTSG